jgi:hypothetical protein
MAMFEEKQQRILDVLIWGISLVFLGIVFLLQNLNSLSWELSRTL